MTKDFDMLKFIIMAEATKRFFDHIGLFPIPDKPPYNNDIVKKEMKKIKTKLKRKLR